MSRLNPPGISLQPGETLLWQGAPDGNVRFFREDRRALLRLLLPYPYGCGSFFLSSKTSFLVDLSSLSQEYCYVKPKISSFLL